ncbi:inositol polyphosphate 5-phosphatase OCRL-like [Schistocerca gregaria]|uniref:inositol polyphosphate 5-phosphatase OCRL-like n=1 Tax=Schistocerca gregaria TaxID=7010 RepID=UPI00211EE214|nr:inositol polyphosphate 5-phosphatase OCRL-like [Schistocerca gregaria]
MTELRHAHQISWVQRQMKLQEEEYTTTFQVPLLCVTWNVNATKEEIEIWPIFLECNVVPEVLLIGFQEVDMSAESVLKMETPRAQQCAETVMSQLQFAAEYIFEPLRQQKQKRGLSELQNEYVEYMSRKKVSVFSGTDQAYVLVEFNQMAGLVNLVAVLKKHKAYISELRVVKKATGVLNILANKGGVAIRFRFYDSTFCFINSHFNAHKSNLTRRTQDYRELSSICFEGLPVETGIYDHDFVIWQGDLNYRVETSTAEAYRLIEEKDWGQLLATDQLTMQMRSGLVFCDWKEAPIAFAPTYKYICNTDSYSKESRRTPSWCDRVLWRSRKGVDCLHYARHELLISDHRPVSCLLMVPVSIADANKQRKVLNQLLREIDQTENEFLPEVTLSTTECDFGYVRFMVASEYKLELTNTGKILCSWEFVPKLDEKDICRPWCKVYPKGGLLMPSEKVQITCTVYINERQVALFNMKQEKIYDILILHLDNSRDHFITLKGKYLVSSFGWSLEQLVRLKESVRTSLLVEDGDQDALMSEAIPLSVSDVPQPEVGMLGSPSDVLSSDPPLPVPKELWMLIDWLYQHAVGVKDLFIEGGITKEMETIRELLDNYLAIPSDMDPHSTAETLLCFLGSLREPLIHPHVYPYLLEAPTLGQVQRLFNSLSYVHCNTLFYIVCLIRYLKENDETFDVGEVAFLLSELFSRQKESASQQAKFWTFVFQLPSRGK